MRPPFFKPSCKDTSCKVTFPDGHTQEFETIEQAAEATSVSLVALKKRCKYPGKETKDGILCEYLNPAMFRKVRNKANRSKGCSFERDIINRLKEEGFEECVSSRQYSRAMDKAKIDVCDPSGKLPVYIQAKYTTSTPQYTKIKNACPFDDKPFVTIWKQATKDGSNSPGTIAMLDYEFFIQLLKSFVKNDCNNSSI